MSDVAVPTSVEITEEAIEAEAAEAEFREGATVAFALARPKLKMEETRNKDSKGHDVILQCQAVILDPENMSTRVNGLPYAGTWNCLPVPTSAEHEPPDWAKGMWAQFCSAFLPGADIDGVGHYPAEGPSTRDGRWYYDGEEIDAGDVATIKRQRAKQRLEFCNAILSTNGACIERLQAYGKFERSKKGRMGISKMFSEAPAEGLSAVEDLVNKVVQGADGGESVTTEKKTPKKKATKKAAGRGRRRR